MLIKTKLHFSTSYSYKFFVWLVIILTFMSVNQWSRIQIGGTFTYWIVSIFIIFYILINNSYFRNDLNERNYLSVKGYLLWLVISIFRGLFIAEGYWEWKQLIEGSMALALPLFVYPFSSAILLQVFLQKWLKVALFAFFVFFIWTTSLGSKHYYLAPILLLSSFISALNRKWKLIFFLLLLMMMFAQLGARSQVIKAVVALLLNLLYLISRRFSIQPFFKIIYSILIFTPIIILYLGLMGIFNPFQNLSNIQNGSYIEKKRVNGQVQEDDLVADTRTFIYEEVIKSAVKNNYVFWGRTPARGNDSVFFGGYLAEELNTGKYERHSNEVCFSNIFTWLGLVGVVLYISIYIRSSYLAIYKSKNLFVKIIGIFIAFHFLFGWIEDFNRLDIANISLWIAISIGFSDEFRNMSDLQFEEWLKQL